MHSETAPLAALPDRLATTSPTEQSPLDLELLRRFVRHRDETAFATLVDRHATMVLRVCRRVLGNCPDVEDAFQATFLVLVRKAGSLCWRQSIANWLYGVAYRVSSDARKQNRRREQRERKIQLELPRDPLSQITVREAQEIVDAEVARLSDKYRAPIVLCYLEGATRDEAAWQLGVSPATLKRRLERGRKLLASRLDRRGLALSVALLIAALTESTAEAFAPAHSIAALLRCVDSKVGIGVNFGAQVVRWANSYLSQCAAGQRLMVLAAVISASLLSLSLLGIAQLTGLGHRSTEGSVASTSRRPVEEDSLHRNSLPPNMQLPKLLYEIAVRAEAVDDNATQVHILTRMGKVLAIHGDGQAARRSFRQAEAIVTQFASAAELPGWQAELAVAQGEVNMIDDALDAAVRIMDVYYRGGSLAEIAADQVRLGDLNGAQRTLNQLRDLRSSTLPMITQRGSTREQVMDRLLGQALAECAAVHLSARRFETALEWIRSAPQAGQRSMMLAQIATAHAHRGNLEAAQAILAEARRAYEAGRRTGQLDPYEQCWDRASLAVAELHIYGDAAAERFAADLNGDPKDMLQLARVQRCVKQGNLAAALESAERIESPYVQSWSWTCIALNRARTGDVHGAEELVSRIPAACWGCKTLADLAVIRSCDEDESGALRTLRTARERIIWEQQQVPRTDLRSVGYDDVAAALVKVGAGLHALRWASEEESPAVQSWILLGVAEQVARCSGDSAISVAQRRHPFDVDNY